MRAEVPEMALESASVLGSAWTTDFGRLSGVGLECLYSAGEKGFSTSGTSGLPTTWMRTPGQLVLEAEATAAVLGRRHDVVHSSVPPSTLYGYVGLLVAAVLRVPFVYDSWGTRRVPLSGDRPLVLTIAPSWRTLPTLLDEFFDSRDPWRPRPEVSVVHAGARAPGTACDTVVRLQQYGYLVRGIELFGASETGLIAFRELTDRLDAPWDVVPDVEVIPRPGTTWDGAASAQVLTIRGQRVGRRDKSPQRSAAVATDDLVASSDGRGLRVVGRASRRVKPAGCWVDLDRLDVQIRDLLPDLRFATAAVDDPREGEHVELRVEAGADVPWIRQHLRINSARLDVVPLQIRPTELAWSPMGKIRSQPGGHPSPKSTPIPGARAS